MENGEERITDPAPAPPGEVSLCSTVFNESESIESWLTSIMNQTRPPAEIVICDAGSTDGTADLISGFASGDTDVKLIVEEGANVPEGRNIAIAAARHPIIAITDAGTVLDEDWLERLVAPLEADPEVAVSAGFYRPAGRSQFEHVLATVITPRRQELADDGFPPSSRSIAFRRDWWEKVGGYPEWLRAGEDLVFDFHLRDWGAQFAFADDAIVSWYPRHTLKAFFDQYKHYARGDGHGHLFTGRHIIRYAAYVGGVLLLIGSRRHWLPRILLAVGFAGYMKKFTNRVRDERPYTDASEALAAYGLVPVVVVTGDIGKMVGYPKGLWERLQAGGPEGLKDARIKSHRTSEGTNRPNDTIPSN
jgi:glycosyltransferase involved in cell wall biosynthesis